MTSRSRQDDNGMSDVTIIGGGIIGVCSAIALQDEGLTVTLIDRGNPEASASYGNCGLLAVGEVVPISKPGMLGKIPGWLLDSKGPLHVRPSALPGQMPWLIRFLLAGRVGRVKEIAAGMAPLLHRAEEDYRALFAASRMPDALVPSENLMAMNARSDYDNDRFTWALRSLHGFAHAFLDTAELRQLEPALSGPIRCGILLKGWLQFSNPGSILLQLKQYFQSRGGTLRTADVTRIEAQGVKAVAVHLASGERLSISRLVLAAGAWSGKLARGLGMRIPVAALQGYHIQLPRPGAALNRPVLYANGGFVLTPLSQGLRIGGTIEVAGLDPKPDFARADILAEKAKAVLPGLDTSGGLRWMGPRPFMPDTMPVIGNAPHHSNVTLAFGHGQVGQTLGSTTGRLVADLVTGRRPGIDLTPYRPTRF